MVFISPDHKGTPAFSGGGVRAGVTTSKVSLSKNPGLA